MSTATARNDHSAPPLNDGVGSSPLSAATINSAHAPVESMPGHVIDIGAYGVKAALESQNNIAAPSCPGDEYLMNAREVAARLGVSERFIRDHTYRRSPRIRGVKMGKLLRYRRVDVDFFLTELSALPPSRRPRRGV